MSFLIIKCWKLANIVTNEIDIVTGLPSLFIGGFLVETTIYALLKQVMDVTWYNSTYFKAETNRHILQ